MTTATVRAALVQIREIATAAITDIDGGVPSVPTPPTNNPPANSVPPPNGAFPSPPTPVPWHADFAFPPNTASPSEKNFNWLKANFGTSWSWAYLVRSPTQLKNKLQIARPDIASNIINTFLGSPSGPPPGMLVPGGTFMIPPNANPLSGQIPFGGTTGPYYTLHAFTPLCNVPLPFPDLD